MQIDLTDDEKTLLRNAMNGLRVQLDVPSARVLVSLVDKINALIPEQKAQANG